MFTAGDKSKRLKCPRIWSGTPYSPDLKPLTSTCGAILKTEVILLSLEPSAS